MARKPRAVVEAESSIKSWEYNYAKDPSVRDRAQEYVLPIIDQSKWNRRAKEEQWMEDLRAWRCVTQDGAMYVGRANIFIPEMRHQIEASVGRFQTGLFPNPDYVNCIPASGTTDERASKIQAAVKYELDYKNNLPSVMERFQRQKVLYGTSPMKCEYVREMCEIFVKDEKGRPSIKRVPKREGVMWRPVDLFHWYQYPETSEPENCEMQFEEFFASKRTLQDDTDKYYGVEDVNPVDSQVNIWNWADTTRLMISDISTAMAALPDAIYVTECWCMFDIEPGKFVPCVISIANQQQAIRVQRNPYYFQTSPYLVGRYLKSTMNEFYGSSLPDALRGLQYVMNDVANQTMDSMTFSLNPIALIDPGFAGDVNSFKLQPGAKWWASPQGVQFATFPDVSGQGFQGMQQIRAMISQFGDDAVSIAPQLSGKVRTATQAQAVQGEMNASLKNMVRCDEFEVMTPMCRMTHSLLQQYQDKAYQIRVQGPDRGSWILDWVNPADLPGDVHWIWKGSSANEKSAIRSQQLLGFLNIAINANAQQPGLIDIQSVYKEVGQDAFGLDEQDMVAFFPSIKAAKSVDPEAENYALDDGQDEVPVNDGDIFELHMDVHTEGYEKAKTKQAKIAYLKHMDRHKVRKQAMDVLREQQAKMAALSAQGLLPGQEPTQGPPGQPGGGQAGPGNKSQTPVSAGGMMAGMRASQPNL